MLNRINELLKNAQANNEVEALMLDTELSPEEATQIAGGYVPKTLGESIEFAYWYYFLR